MLSKASQMRLYAREDCLSEDFWSAVHQILAQAGRPTEHDERGRIKALYDYSLQFDFIVAPPLVTQYLMRPRALYERRMGDCTAMATFISAAAAVLGFKSDFVFMSAAQDGDWQHVWSRVYIPARGRLQYFDVDPTYRESDAKFGWHYPDAHTTRLCEIEVF